MPAPIQTVPATGIPSAAGRTAIDSITAKVDDNSPAITQDYSFIDGLTEAFPDIVIGTAQNTLYNIVRGIGRAHV